MKSLTEDLEHMDFSYVNGITELGLFEKSEICYEYTQYLKEKGHYCFRRIGLTGSGPEIEVLDSNNQNTKRMIYMASNDYLNLTKHPRTIKAGIEAIKKYGAGAGSVPLLGGTLDIHVEMEQRIAKFKGCEDAIVYTSGFGSNAGSLLAMLGKADIAILDLYVHASIIDGCKNTNVKFFMHNNTKSLEKTLDKVKGKYKTILIVVDGVYSMDGDIAPLDKIVDIAHSYGGYVMVDEAHATGVIGEHGRGTPEHYKIEGKVDIVAGTLSKGIGAVGGFIAGNKELIEYLRFFSRPYMFSTAPPPQVAGTVIEALNVIEEEKERRERLWSNIHYFKNNLLELGFNIGNSETAIFPIIVGDAEKVKEACRILDEECIYANYVLYPAVPKKLSRIRLSIMSEHKREHLDKALNVLESVGKKLQII